MSVLRVPPKNSILKRPIRKGAARPNSETADTQFELEQQKLANLRLKREALADNRRGLLFGSKRERARIHSKEQNVMEQHRQLKAQQEMADKADDRAIANEMRKHYAALNKTESAQKAARKNYNLKLLNENQRLSQYRAQLQQQRKQNQISEDKQLCAEHDEQWTQNVF